MNTPKITSKVCQSCLLDLPVSEFHKHKRTKDGLQHDCIPCHRDRMRTYYRSERGRNVMRAAVRRYRARLKAHGVKRMRDLRPPKQ